MSSALATALRSEAPLEREVAAMRLSEAGEDGARALASLALDHEAPSPSRVTALRYLPAIEAAVPTLALLLQDPVPVLRVIAMEKAAEVGAASLRPLVEALTRDPASFWDLDEKIAVADIAAQALGRMS